MNFASGCNPLPMTKLLSYSTIVPAAVIRPADGGKVEAGGGIVTAAGQSVH